MKTFGFLILTVCIVSSMALAAAPPVLTLHVVPYINTPVRIDGKLDDACWHTVPQTSTFYKFWTMDPVATPLQTAFQMCYDEQGIYLAVRMLEKEPGKIKATITQRDDPNLWTDDCAEIYFDSEGTATGYRKFTLNALGTKQDLYRMDLANNDESWSPDGWQAATNRDDKGWYIEAFFPWSDLGKKASDGDLWRFCLVRFSWSSGGWNGGLVTSAPGGNYNNTDRFGWLLFIRSDISDLTKLSRELEARIPGDWLCPLQNKAALKTQGKVTITTMSKVLSSQRREAQVQVEECRRIVVKDETALKACKEMSEQLEALSTEVSDPVIFQQQVRTLTKMGQQLEDLRYTALLKELFARRD